MAVSPGLSEIVTTTLRDRSGELRDQILRNNALLLRLNKRGKVKPFSGGRTIVQELAYSQNSSAGWYSGYEQLNISPSDVMTAAEFAIRQAAVAVSISGLEMLQNSGENAVIDLLESRIENAENTMQNLIASAVYSDGSDARQIGGLQFLIAGTPTTGVVGGIDRASWQFWRNIAFSSVTDGGAAATSANIQSYMNRVYVQLVNGNDNPDLIIADNNYWRLYLESLQAIQRITSEEMGQAGFQSLKYMSADVVLDGGFQGYVPEANAAVPAGGAGAPTNTMYFINTKYVNFRPHKDRNMVPLDDGRVSVNQDAMVKLIAFAGNMTLSNARKQAVLRA